MKRILLLLGLWLAWMPSARAVLTIDITQGAESALPIAIVPFGQSGNSPAPEDLAAIVRADLQRSGRFAPTPLEQLPARPDRPNKVDFAAWRGQGVQYLVIGHVNSPTAGRYGTDFYLFNVSRGEQITGFRFVPAETGALRRIAHRISDMIYEALLGEKGSFDSRIAYVSASGVGKQRRYQLHVADVDGANRRTILSSNEPLLSPDWSPDGLSLAYVSLENKRTAVYVQSVLDGRRQQVAAWDGLNTAPAWAPDGRRLALSLSRDGNPEIYILDLASRQLQRLTNSPAIDTEPTWAPDGQSLVFTSDRGGRPQLYQIPISGGAAQRLTFSGKENAGASFSPDGNKLALLHDNRVAVMDLQSRQITVLSQTNLDESPSFSPNGGMLVYADGNALAAVSVDGSVRQRLQGDPGLAVREPVWSPLNR